MSAGSVIVNVIADDTKYREGMARATRATRQAASSWQRDLQTASRGFTDMTSIAGRAGIALAGAFSIGSLATAADKVAQLAARVKQSTLSLTEFNEAFRTLSRSAVAVSADLSSGVEIFQRLSFSRSELKATSDEMLLFTDTVQKLGIASGATQDALKFGLTQLGQSLSSDIVRAEEFNSILENIPAVGNAIAKELGVSTGELRKLVISGQLLSKDVFAAILKQSEEANANFAQMPVTIEKGVTSALGGVSLFAAEFNKASGATITLGEALRDVGVFLSENTELAASFGDGLRLAVTSTLAPLENMLGLIKAIGTGLKLAAEVTLNPPILQAMGVKPVRLGGGGGINADAMRDDYDDVTRQMRVAMAGGGAREVSQDYTKLAAGADKAGKEAAKRQKELNSLYEKNREAITGLDTATLKYIDTQNDLDALRRAGIITNREYAESVRRVDDEFQKSTEKAQAWGVDLEQLGKRAAENIQDEFADFLFDPLDKGWDGMAKGFIDAVRRMGAEAAAANLARLLLGSTTPGGKSNNDGLMSGITSGVGGFFKDIFSGFHADGGFIGPGQWGIVGEEGPEPVFGGPSGMTVMPNETLGGNQYFIDARGADQGAVRRIEQALIALAGPGRIEQRVGSAEQRGIL